MKKFLGSLSALGMAAILAFQPSQANANPANLDYDITINNQKMMYDDNQLNQDYPVSIDLTNAEADSSKLYYIQRIDTNGNVRETIDQDLISLDTNGEGTFEYTFDLEAEEGFAYRVYDEDASTTVMKGYVQDRPDSNAWQGGGAKSSPQGEAVALNGVPYNDIDSGFMHDAENPQATLIQENDTAVIHYIMPGVLIDNGDEITIDVYDEETNEIVTTISSEDLFEYQGLSASEIPTRGIIAINTGDSLPGYVEGWTANEVFDGNESGDNFFTMEEWNNGVYSFEIDNQENQLETPGEAPVYVGDRRTMEWALNPENTEIPVESDINWNTVRETREINAVYSNHDFIDEETGTNEGNQLDNYNRNTTVSYGIADSLTDGDIGFATWNITQPGGWANGANEGDYNVSLSDSYDVVGEAPFTDAISDSLLFLGLDDDAGERLFSIIIMVIATLALALYGANLTMLAIANGGLLAFFSVMGFLPAWLILLMIMFIIGGLVLQFQKGDVE